MRMVYLNTALAVDAEECREVEESLLKCSEAAGMISKREIETQTKTETETEAKTETDSEPEPLNHERLSRQLYHRSPRNVVTLETGKITIEEPPEPERMREQSFLQMIGSSVLMVIPMIVGCSMMIASSRLLSNPSETTFFPVS